MNENDNHINWWESDGISTGLANFTNGSGLQIDKFSLHGNYPNLFNPTTHIRFGLPKASNVKIDVYNTLGQKVATLLDEHKLAGVHVVDFDGSHFASGLYLYYIQTGDFQQVKKMLLLK